MRTPRRLRGTDFEFVLMRFQDKKQSRKIKGKTGMGVKNR